MPAALESDELVDYPLAYEDQYGAVDTVCQTGASHIGRDPQ